MAGALLNYNGQALMTQTGAYAINNLTPENIKSGVQIGGITGTYTGSYAPSMTVELRPSRFSMEITDVGFEVKTIMFQIQTTPSGYYISSGYVTPSSSATKFWVYKNNTTAQLYTGYMTFTQTDTTVTITNSAGMQWASSYYYNVILLG